MANAWIVQPQAMANVTSSPNATTGAATNLALDYAGIVLGIAGSAMAGSGPTYRHSIVADLGADVTIDTLLLFGLVPNLPAGTTCNVTAATSAQGIGYNGRWGSANFAPYSGSAIAASGTGVVVWSAPSSGPPAARYWELIFNSPSRFDLQASRLVLGRRIQLQRNFGYGGLFGVRDLGALDFSARAVLLRRRGRKLRTLQLTFSNIRKDEVEAATKPLLEQIGSTEMVAVVTDPSADPQLQNRCYYGPLLGDLGQTWRNAAAWEAKLSLVSIF